MKASKQARKAFEQVYTSMEAVYLSNYLHSLVLRYVGRLINVSYGLKLSKCLCLRFHRYGKTVAFLYTCLSYYPYTGALNVL